MDDSRSLTGSGLGLNIDRMSFFKDIKSAIYSPDFYTKINKRSLGTSLKYFFGLVLLLTLINVLMMSYELAVKIPGEIRSFISQATGSIPEDLTVVIDKGRVTTNTQEPLFIPFPELNNEIGQDSLNNILVIDTKTPYSSTQFNQYKTLFWLTNDSLFYQNREFDQRSIDLSKSDNFTVNRNLIADWVSKINPWLNALGPILIFLVFIGLFIGFSFNLIYFMFLAVLIFFLSSIFKWGLSYSSSYKTAIYCSTLSFFIDLILFNTGIYTGFFGFPFLFTLTGLCIATVNLQNFEKSV